MKTEWALACDSHQGTRIALRSVFEFATPVAKGTRCLRNGLLWLGVLLIFGLSAAPLRAGLFPCRVQDTAKAEAPLFKEEATIVHEFEGEGANDEFGWVARRVGDLNGDGANDFVTTAPGHGNGKGKIYVYSSRDGALLFSHEGHAGERLGNGAAGAGDVNADGVPDVIVGAPRHRADGESGRAIVYSGKDGKTLLALVGKQAGDRFGYKVSGAGDLNGDGHEDVLVTSLAGEGQQPGSGCCDAYSGKDGALLFTLKGERASDSFGSAVAGCLEGEQRMFAVGAKDAGANRAGRVYVYEMKGSAPTLKFTIEADDKSKDLGQMFVAFPGDVDGDGVVDVFASDFTAGGAAPGVGCVVMVSGKTGEQLYRLEGTHAQEGFGTSISDALDVTGDGRGDLAIGAWQNHEEAPSAGKIYLYDGASGKRIRTWTCRQAGDTCGFDATGLGDINNDGVAELLITSAWSGVKQPKCGRVFIISAK